MSTMTRIKSEPVATIPNALTFARFVLVPLIAAGLLLDEWVSRWTPFAMFLTAGITDWLDGFVARTTGQNSTLGQIFDPVADKLLICSTLFVLAALGELTDFLIVPALLILWRELMVSGLREYSARAGSRIAVAPLAKWKTTVQMIAIGALLAAPAVTADAHVWEAGAVILWLAAFLSLYTAFGYGWTARMMIRA